MCFNCQRRDYETENADLHERNNDDAYFGSVAAIVFSVVVSAVALGVWFVWRIVMRG